MPFPNKNQEESDFQNAHDFPDAHVGVSVGAHVHWELSLCISVARPPTYSHGTHRRENPAEPGGNSIFTLTSKIIEPGGMLS